MEENKKIESEKKNQELVLRFMKNLKDHDEYLKSHAQYSNDFGEAQIEGSWFVYHSEKHMISE